MSRIAGASSMTNSLYPSYRVGIIGGLGQLGSWCGNLFREIGCKVLVTDVGTELTNTALVPQVNVVVVTVPIGVTGAVLEEICPQLREDQLLVDLTSVKTPFVTEMERSKAEVLSAHPMFAPTLASTAGQSCVVCRVRVGDKSRWFEDVLREAGLRLVEMTPDSHDRTMAIVQGLTHFQAIVAGHCMAAMGFQPSESLATASPVYKARLAMIGRILAQNPRLYAEIQIFNPYVRSVLAHVQRSSELLAGFVEAQDVDGFAREFVRVREALGGFCEQSLEGE